MNPRLGHALPFGALVSTLGACAAMAGQTTAAETPRPTHPHPSTLSMDHSLERVSGDAVRCLRPGDVANVTGEFQGGSGQFQAIRVATPNGDTLPYPIETCVRVAAERAHVRAFTDDTASYSYTFTGPAPETASTQPATSAAPAPAPLATSPVLMAPIGTMEIASRPSPNELVRREGDALQRCYEQAAERDHTLAGRIDLHLTLDASGRIARLSSAIQTQNEDVTLMQLVARCLEAHVRLIQFGPQSSTQTDVAIPITFSPGGIPID